MDVAKGTAEEFVTVVSVGSQPTSESFVTVLSIGNGKGDDDDDVVDGLGKSAANGIDGHLEEEVEVYRLPGERLGFGLKFEGGNKTSERVRRLFVQSCAEQSPASRAKCTWGTLGEGDEVLSIDGIPVTHMTRLDCVRRLKESQLVIRLMVRCRGALRPEVVSAERKLSTGRSKVPPELPPAPPPVPPRKLRQPRGSADGEANPGPVRRSWDSSRSPATRGAGGGTRERAAAKANCQLLEDCEPRCAVNGSPRATPKDRGEPELAKSKQEPPEAMVYLDARSQCGSTHGSTSDDTGSSMSTVVDRFSMSDRMSTVSTVSTASTASEQQQPGEQLAADRDADRPCERDALLSRAICPLERLEREFPSNPPDYLLRRLASSEAVTHVESRGEVERITAVIAPNTVLIEETITLQPPLSFQDAPLSYGHETRPDLFYTGDLAGNSTTHFRPIKDDVELVERVNGDFGGGATDRTRDGSPSSPSPSPPPPPLPARNHVNRICVNQSSAGGELVGRETRPRVTVAREHRESPPDVPLLPPKPLPRKDVKTRRKRPPPPPPPPSRREFEEPPTISSRGKETENGDLSRSESAEYVRPRDSSTSYVAETRPDDSTESATRSDDATDARANEVSETIGSGAAGDSENGEKRVIASNESIGAFATVTNGIERAVVAEENGVGEETVTRSELRNDNSATGEEANDDEGTINGERCERSRDETLPLDKEDGASRGESEDDETYRSLDEVNDDMRDPEVNRMLEDEEAAEEEEEEVDTTDESDDGEYYWQSNLATIGEEEETNSLEYVNVNVADDPGKPPVQPEESPPTIKRDTLVKNDAVNGKMENCGGGQRLPPDGDEFPAAYQEFGNGQPYRYIAATARPTTAAITANGGLCAENETLKMLANDSNVVGSRSTVILSDSKMTLTGAENVRQDTSKVALANTENVRPEMSKTASAGVAADNMCRDPKSLEIPNDERKSSSYQAAEELARKKNAVSGGPLYSCQTSNGGPPTSENKTEIAGYYHKDAIEEMPSRPEKDMPVDTPPPLPLTGPPKMEQAVPHARSVPTTEYPQRKFSLNGDLWRQDDRSERSVRDKIAMFSSQSNLDASPPFPNAMAAAAATAASNGKRISKYKSSEDVCCDDKSNNGPKERPSFFADRTQSSFDLTDSARATTTTITHESARKYGQRGSPAAARPVLPSPAAARVPKTLPVVPPKIFSTAKSCACANESVSVAYPDVCNQHPTTKTTSTPPLTRATSFSGSTTFAQDQPGVATTVDSQIARTNSLASTFRRPGEDARRSSLNQLIEQRRRSISKLRGLVIPEKDPLPIEQPIVDLPEIKSRDSILLHQMPKANIQDKWGSQSSLASNASTASVPLKATTSFKMPAPQINSKYSPAFKRKSLAVYGTTAVTSSPMNGGTVKTPQTPAYSEPPKSLESICSPTRSDYSFEFASTTSSPDGTRVRSRGGCAAQRKARADYDDSDNDSAVSSSQSSISRGFSPPMSPAPSEKSTVSSERSYVSAELGYQRRALIADSSIAMRNVRDHSAGVGQFGATRIGAVLGERSPYLTAERSSSSSSGGSNPRSPQPSNELLAVSSTAARASQIPQRQLRRSNSTDTNCSTSSTLTSGSQASAESLSRRVLKPRSVEAINRKNILASARCRSGRDLNGSPLIQRKFSDDEEPANAATRPTVENGVRRTINDNPGSDSVANEREIKIAYIEDTVAESEAKFRQKGEEPKLPPKKSVPPPIGRPPKSELLEPSNDLKMWVRAEAKTLARNAEEKSSGKVFNEKTSPVVIQNLVTSLPAISQTRNSRGSAPFNEPIDTSPNGGLSSSKNRVPMTVETKVAAIEASKQPSRASLTPRKSAEEPEDDLLTILTTKSRSRSAIHVDEGTFGSRSMKSQMSLEDILGAKADPKLLRAQSVEPKVERNGASTSPQVKSAWEPKESSRYGRRSSSTSSESSWSEDRPSFVSKIPTLGRAKMVDSGDEIPAETVERAKNPMGSKIPTCRGLNRRSVSVTDMKKALEKASPAHDQSRPPNAASGGAHNRFPSLDSSVDENACGTETDNDRCYGEQFGSISSLASSTSLISQQELAQLVEEASLEEARGVHDVIVVLLHKEKPNGSVGITLAGGTDCEVKEITVHRVLAHSVAERDGRVQRGDRILSINGRSTRGLTHQDSMMVLKQPRSEVVLVVSRAKMEEGCKLRSRTASVETIVEGLETNGSVEDIAWGPPAIVAVYKDGAGLGFSLEGGRDSPLGDRPLIIKKIFTGGAAEKTGALRAGDQLLEVNGNDVTRMSRIEAWSLMKKLHDGEVNLLVRHPATKSS